MIENLHEIAGLTYVYMYIFSAVLLSSTFWTRWPGAENRGDLGIPEQCQYPDSPLDLL